MPELNADDQSELEGEVEEAEGETEEVEAEATETATGKDAKRISALQSEKDKETARANKLQKQLDALQAGAGSGEGSGQGGDPETTALRQELREASLDAVYGEFEELKQFGIDRALIEGATRAEMRESATALVALVKSVATKATNATLAKHGIKAEPSGTTRTPPKSYAQMSDEEFEKEYKRAKQGGGTLWGG